MQHEVNQAVTLRTPRRRWATVTSVAFAALVLPVLCSPDGPGPKLPAPDEVNYVVGRLLCAQEIAALWEPTGVRPLSAPVVVELQCPGLAPVFYGHRWVAGDGVFGFGVRRPGCRFRLTGLLLEDGTVETFGALPWTSARQEEVADLGTVLLVREPDGGHLAIHSATGRFAFLPANTWRPNAALNLDYLDRVPAEGALARRWGPALLRASERPRPQPAPPGWEPPAGDEDAVATGAAAHSVVLPFGSQGHSAEGLDRPETPPSPGQGHASRANGPTPGPR